MFVCYNTIQPKLAREPSNLVFFSFQVEDIYYFHAEQKYVTVRHVEGEVLIEEPLKNLETEFSERFHRIHRNALVNLSWISGLQAHNDRYQVIFRDIDQTLEISRRHLPGLRKILKAL